MAKTLKYCLSTNGGNVSDATTEAPLLVDGSVTDNTTYYRDTDTGTGAVSYITAIYDLESASRVARLRFRFGYQYTPTYTFSGSNDGTSWTSAFVNPLPPALTSNGGTFAWNAGINQTNITTTNYRYWRLVVYDTADVSPGTSDVRLGDFRIYDASDVEYVPVFNSRRRSYPGVI